jgi:hypothetical protein
MKFDTGAFLVKFVDLGSPTLEENPWWRHRPARQASGIPGRWCNPVGHVFMEQRNGMWQNCHTAIGSRQTVCVMQQLAYFMRRAVFIFECISSNIIKEHYSSIQRFYSIHEEIKCLPVTCVADVYNWFRIHCSRLSPVLLFYSDVLQTACWTQWWRHVLPEDGSDTSIRNCGKHVQD